MFETIPKAIYDKIFDIISTNSTFDYVKTKQRGFVPLDENLLNPTLYPWIFTEFGGFTQVECIRMPNVWSYNMTINIVCMTFADMGDIDSLVFNSDSGNINKGVVQMAGDVGDVLWNKYKSGGYGISGIRDWTISRVGTPGIMNIQGLLMSPLIRGIQIDLVIQIEERT